MKKRWSVPPLRNLRKLAAQNTVDDYEFVQNLNKSSLWAHFRDDEVVLKDSEELTPKSKGSVRVKSLQLNSRSGDIYSTISDTPTKVNARELEAFKNHQHKRRKYLSEYLEWDVKDTGKVID